MKGKRVRVSDAVAHQVLIEAGYKCASPVCRQVITIDVHHIEWVKDGGGGAKHYLDSSESTAPYFDKILEAVSG